MSEERMVGYEIFDALVEGKLERAKNLMLDRGFDKVSINRAHIDGLDGEWGDQSEYVDLALHYTINACSSLGIVMLYDRMEKKRQIEYVGGYVAFNFNKMLMDLRKIAGKNAKKVE